MVIYVLRNVHTVWLYYRLWVFGHNGGGWDNAVCRVLPRLVRRYTNHYLYHSTTPATLSLLLSPAVATIVSHHHLRAQCFYAILLVLFVCFASDCDSSAPKTMSTLIYFTHFGQCVTRLDFVVCTYLLTDLMFFAVICHCITSAGVVTALGCFCRLYDTRERRLVRHFASYAVENRA